MREKTDFQQNNHEQLRPELLRKISKNETQEELIITGEADYGFFGDNTDFFQDAVISAFLKNKVTKIVVLDAVSLETISLLLPVLSNIPNLKIRNLCFDRITHLCNELSKSFPKAPIIEFDDEIMDKKFYHEINSFNQQRTESLDSISCKKRELETENEIEDSNKKRRVDNEMVVEELNITPPNQPVVQNTSDLLVFSKDIIEFPEEEVKAFEQIRKAYLASAKRYVIEPIAKISKSKNQEIKREFLDLPNKNRCPDYKKFIPMLSKTTSPISELIRSTLLLAVKQGNRDVVNFLLGGKVRMVFDEPTPENKKAVLAEYELLVIKKPIEKLTYLEKKTPNLYFLGFKNDQGQYEERPIIHKISSFRESSICKEAAAVRGVIKSAEEFNASQNFFYTYHLKSEIVNAIIEVALEKGHLQILYDAIEYDTFRLRTGNDFYCMIERLGEIAVKHNCVLLLKHLVTIHKDLIDIKPLIEQIIKNKQFDLLDSLFNWCLLSDADIESYLRYTTSLDVQEYFFDSNKNHFYSIATQSQGYTVQVIHDKNVLPEHIDKVLNDIGMSVILSVSVDNEYTLGFSSNGEYKEHLITDEMNETLMQEIILKINNDSNIVDTSGWLTRHLRLLLLSLSADTPVQFDPAKLAAIVCSSCGSEFQGKLSTLRDDPFDLLNLLFKNKYFDLSINDNQFLKQLAEIFNTCNQILNRTPEDQRKIDKLGSMILSLSSDSRINPVSDSENLDDYVRGIQFVIENGYHAVLPIFFKYKPQQSPLLYEIFLNYTQMMNIALETCEKSHFETIIPILLEELTFYHLSNYESMLYPQCAYTHQQLSMHLNDINTKRMNYHPDYIAHWQEKFELLSQQLKGTEEQLNKNNQNNFRLLKAVVSSPRVFHSKEVDEWVTFLSDRKIHCPSFLTYLERWEWEKVKPLKELQAYPYRFFAVNQYVPQDIYNVIEETYLAVISKQ